jgi:hypothetical protein
MKFLVLCLLVGLSTVPALAVEDVVTTETAVVTLAVAEAPLNPGPSIGDVIRIGRDLVAFGEELYNLVSRGRPTLSTQYAPISVLPAGSDGREVSEMQGWRRHPGLRVTTTYRNRLGMTLAVFEYTVLFEYAGTTREGRGRYIANAMVVPSRVHAEFGQNFESEMSLRGISNIGTTQNPVAAATLSIRYRVTNLVSAVEMNDIIAIDARGVARKL